MNSTGLTASVKVRMADYIINVIHHYIREDMMGGTCRT